MDVQPIVIGTAGHIDHGKSTLVRALTGIDPDRLKEEKERGLTIDLGFARLPLEDGRLVGIVDVPGHERFIRNMLAGATGIDIVVLVIAADDGVMPQTREHLAIMELLGVSRGFVALTKIDAVEEDMVELAAEEVRELLQGTFLAQAPILRVSAVTGEGLPELRALLVEMAAASDPRPADGVFRMPIQRVFTARGFGTVVTGIPVAGRIGIGDTIEIVPGGLRGRVRGIQAYGLALDAARAGHSTALNVSDVPHERVRRGFVAASPSFFSPVRMVGARLATLPSNTRAVENRMPVRFHIGTADVSGELVLLDEDALAPGETGLVQIRLDEPVVCAPGDPFVLRLLSPGITLGGGRVLEESRYRLKRFKEFVIDELRRQETGLGSPVALLESILARRGMESFSAEDLTTAIKRSKSEVAAFLDELVREKRVASPGASGRFLHVDRLEEALSKVRAAFDAWFLEHPLRTLVDVRELRTLTGLEPAFLQALLEEFRDRGEVEILAGGRVRQLGRSSGLGAEVEEIANALVVLLEADPFQPPGRAELPAALGRTRAEIDPVLDHLVDTERVVHVGADLYFASSAIARAREALIECFERHGHLEIPELRDRLATTRKFLIPLLEYFDAQGVTIRQGAHRVLKRR